MSLPHNLYLSERTASPRTSAVDSLAGVGGEAEGGSNPNLQQHRSDSPFTRAMPHSSSFTASPYRRPHSAAAAGGGAPPGIGVQQHGKGFHSSTVASAARPICPDPGSPVPPLEEVQEEFECASSLPTYLPGTITSVDAAAGVLEKNMRQESEGGEEGDRDVQDKLNCKEDSSDGNSRSLNILVYAANNEAYFESIKKTLSRCFRKDRYVIYHLSTEVAFKSPWSSNTALLVICGDVPAHVSTSFIKYLLAGGSLLSICSDFLNVAVPLFGTVEVAESEVVGVRYGRWGSVPFLHHQHCSHSSPQTQRFSTNLEQGDGPGTAPKQPSCRPRGGGTVSVEPTHVEIRDTDGSAHCLELRVLATDDTWGAPSLLGATITGGKGKGVFSQVHLERDPASPTAGPLPYGISTSTLQRSAAARIEILRDLLSTELGMDTAEGEEEEEEEPVKYTPGVLLGEQKLQTELLQRLRPRLIGGRELHRPQLRVVFVPPAGEDVPEATEDLLPVLWGPNEHRCQDFDENAYFEHLQTTCLGRLVLYVPVLGSSSRVVDGATPLHHGLVVVPHTQTKGVGRGGNVWLSPVGCLMFSLQLHLPVTSFLGSHLPLLQHIVALAVVRAIENRHLGLSLSLKWPNDMYAGDDKVGGVLVTASHSGTTACANIGVGVNLTNSAPTVSILTTLQRQHREAGLPPPPAPAIELTLASILNTLEQLLTTVEQRGPEPLLQMYYSCWKHSGARVTVVQAEELSGRSSSRTRRIVTITGIDYYGFLRGVDCNTGAAVSVHPDGNSFNMMEGLVYTKTGP